MQGLLPQGAGSVGGGQSEGEMFGIPNSEDSAVTGQSKDIGRMEHFLARHRGKYCCGRDDPGT